MYPGFAQMESEGTGEQGEWETAGAEKVPARAKQIVSTGVQPEAC
jgi:hypothetical protein